MTADCGFGVGLQFRDNKLVVNEKNETVIEPGMVFSLSLGLADLVEENPR
jgi:nucleosome binding factor SPN SPT16 subunit